MLGDKNLANLSSIDEAKYVRALKEKEMKDQMDQQMKNMQSNNIL